MSIQLEIIISNSSREKICRVPNLQECWNRTYLSQFDINFSLQEFMYSHKDWTGVRLVVFFDRDALQITSENTSTSMKEYTHVWN